MASVNFTNLAKHLAKGTINFDSDAFKCMLVSAVPSVTDGTGDMDLWEFRDDVDTEVTGTAYSAGGEVCTPASAGTLVLASQTYQITFANFTIASSTITARGAIIYRNVGTAATDELISFVDFGTNITSTAGDFNVTFSDTLDIVVAS